jgi:hypothetical protein
MTNYTIYFELFGKKMKTTLPATSKENAKEVIRNMIIFHKITTNDSDNKEADEILRRFKDIINGKK